MYFLLASVPAAPFKPGFSATTYATTFMNFSSFLPFFLYFPLAVLTYWNILYKSNDTLHRVRMALSTGAENVSSKYYICFYKVSMHLGNRWMFHETVRKHQIIQHLIWYSRTSVMRNTWGCVERLESRLCLISMKISLTSSCGWTPIAAHLTLTEFP